LAFAAIAETSGLSITQSRKVANGLIDLNLLTMTACFDAAKNKGADERLPAVAEALKVAGASEASINQTVSVLIDLAVGVERSLGKPQKMLRSAAEKMLTPSATRSQRARSTKCGKAGSSRCGCRTSSKRRFR
jgi:hypothetical protein